MTRATYRVDEVAVLLSVSERQVRKWIHDGKIQAVIRISQRTIRIPTTELNRLISSNTIRKTQS